MLSKAVETTCFCRHVAYELFLLTNALHRMYQDP